MFRCTMLLTNTFLMANTLTRNDRWFANCKWWRTRTTKWPPRPMPWLCVPKNALYKLHLHHWNSHDDAHFNIHPLWRHVWDGTWHITTGVILRDFICTVYLLVASYRMCLLCSLQLHYFVGSLSDLERNYSKVKISNRCHFACLLY